MSDSKCIGLLLEHCTFDCFSKAAMALLGFSIDGVHRERKKVEICLGYDLFIITR